MQKDLKLFNELVEYLISEEKNNPVATPIDTTALYTTLDLSLNDDPIIDEDF